MAISSIRFSGMASGLDTDSIVKAMLMPQQAKIDKQKQQEILLNWKKDAWKEMNNKINTFYTKHVSNLRLESAFGKNIVSVSNPNALEVNTKGDIPAGTHQVKITELATGAYMQNKAMGTIEVDGTTTLAQLGIKEATTIRIEKYDVDGEVTGFTTIELNPGDSLEGVKDKLRDEGLILTVENSKIKLMATGIDADKVTVKVVSGNSDPDEPFLGDSGLLSKLGLGSNISLKEGAAITSKDYSVIDKNTRLSLLGITSGTISVNGLEPIELSDIETIGQLEAALKNADKSLNVNFDVANKRFFISSKETGTEAKIDIIGDADITDNELKKLGLLHDSSGDFDTLKGSNAKYTYNGMDFESASNQVAINGITMTLKAKSEEVINITATKDTQAVVDSFKAFIEEYNKLIDEINTKLGAKKSYKYNPLTDEQKKDMKETDIKVWEDKVKEGLFSNDPQLRQVGTMMREILGTTVTGGNYKILSQVGITTGDWRDKGKLVFNEEKFKKALEEDSAGVMNLFAGAGNEIAAKDAYLIKNPGGPYTDQDKKNYFEGTKGIAVRLYEMITQEMKSTDLRSYGSFYNDRPINAKLTSISQKIYDLDRGYTNLENMYYKKFTAMEKTMSQLNTQSNWLGTQLGGM